MFDSFICPDCRSVHDEPAEAIYLLIVRCLDCELHTRFHADQAAAVSVPIAA